MMGKPLYEIISLSYCFAILNFIHRLLQHYNDCETFQLSAFSGFPSGIYYDYI